MPQTVCERLKALEFLVVADFFLSETAELADVVLPCTQWAEEEGTLTNLEGRVLRRRKVAEPPAGVRSDIDILCALGQRLGHRRQFTYANSEAVFDELRRASRGGPADYFGITLRARRNRAGRVLAVSVDRSPRHAAPVRRRVSDAERPRALSRRLASIDRRGARTRSTRSTSRPDASSRSTSRARRRAACARSTASAAQPFVEMHPATARVIGVASGDRVVLTTRRGSATFVVKTTTSIREDTVFVPFHWAGEQSANRLTNTALDPTSKMPEFKVCATRIERAAYAVAILDKSVRVDFQPTRLSGEFAAPRFVRPVTPDDSRTQRFGAVESLLLDRGQTMSLPLLKRATEDGVTFVLTPVAHSDRVPACARCRRACRCARLDRASSTAFTST